MATGALVAFTALSAGAQIVKGIQQNAAYTEHGIALMKQAQIAQYENSLAIKQKQREIDKVAARQVMAMAKNGMDTSAGSPLEILHETAELGQEEVDALRLQGRAQINKYRSDANTAFNSGRSALIGGAVGAVSSIANTAIGGYTNGIWGGAANKATSSVSGSLTGFTPSIFNNSGYKGTLPSLGG